MYHIPQLFRLFFILSQIVPQSQLVLSQTSQQPNPCARWGHQTSPARRNSSSNSPDTLWIYGGQTRFDPNQNSNTWTNALVTLPLSQEWPTGTPPLTLAEPDSSGSNSHSSASSSQPPPVSLGALWSPSSGSSIVQFFGSFSDTPTVSPLPNAVWQYDISGGGKWSELDGVQGLDQIQRSAEGASAIVPGAGTNGEGVAYYAFGHLDTNSANQWSQQTDRVYLSSMVKYDLGAKSFYNFTTYPSQGSTSGIDNSTAEAYPIYRADHTLTFVPHMGKNGQGILVSIGGGNDQQLIENNILDVFDLGSGGWTKQATQGDILTARTNHCAVRASASVNGKLNHFIWVYGGQNANQTARYSDIYILTIPSFTWTRVGDDLPSQPQPRAGHTCDIAGSQMISVGGLVSEDFMCDQSGVYVFNISASQWETRFVPESTFTTPDILSSVIGGSGTGNSTSSAGGSQGGNGTATGGEGNGNGNGGSDDGGNGDGNGNGNGGNIHSDHGSINSSKIAAAVGGAVGGFLCLCLVAFLWLRYRYQSPRRVQLPPWLGGPARELRHHRILSIDSDTSSESSFMAGTPFEKRASPIPTAGQFIHHAGPERPLLIPPASAVPADAVSSVRPLLASDADQGRWPRSQPASASIPTKQSIDSFYGSRPPNTGRSSQSTQDGSGKSHTRSSQGAMSSNRSSGSTAPTRLFSSPDGNSSRLSTPVPGGPMITTPGINTTNQGPLPKGILIRAPSEGGDRSQSDQDEERVSIFDPSEYDFPLSFTGTAQDDAESEYRNHQASFEDGKFRRLIPRPLLKVVNAGTSSLSLSRVSSNNTSRHDHTPSI